jgi:hypothetical protein
MVKAQDDIHWSKVAEVKEELKIPLQTTLPLA